VSLLSPLPPVPFPSSLLPPLSLSLLRQCGGRRGPERQAETAASGGGAGVARRLATASGEDTGVATAAPGLSSTASSPTATSRSSRRTAAEGTRGGVDDDDVLHRHRRRSCRSRRGRAARPPNPAAALHASASTPEPITAVTMCAVAVHTVPAKTDPVNRNRHRRKRTKQFSISPRVPSLSRGDGDKGRSGGGQRRR